MTEERKGEVTITRSEIQFLPTSPGVPGVWVKQITEFRGPRCPKPNEAAGATTHAMNHLMKEMMSLGFTDVDLDQPDLHVTPHADGLGLQVRLSLRGEKRPVEIVIKEIASETKH